MIFDVLWLDGHLLIERPHTERRAVLERLDLRGPAWQTPPVSRDDGQAALDTSRKLGFDVVIAKRSDSRYEPGRRSRSWLEISVTSATRRSRQPARRGRASGKA
jgi:bifunctional non-homologous end joining protein LigD